MFLSHILSVVSKCLTSSEHLMVHGWMDNVNILVGIFATSQTVQKADWVKRSN